MRIGMMQPYFFPYLGYFGLIHATDRWIVFDTAQYIRRGWVNRNRILSSGPTGWKHVTVPVVRCDRSTAIKDIQVDSRQEWQRNLVNSLDVYRVRKAPHYQQTLGFLQQTLSLKTDDLNELLVHCLEQTCQYLELPIRCELFSTMNLSLPPIEESGDWTLETSVALNATTYINPPGGRILYDPHRFQQRGIELRFLEARLPEYEQGGDAFQPGLSVIDALMWNSPERVREMVCDYELAAA